MKPVIRDQNSPQAFARARPIRIAFLVEEDKDADALLDAVFANCYSRWGGRYSLIVPCQNGLPNAAWLAWLEAYDPDIIYSYIKLSESAVESLHERFGPAHLAIHEPHGDEQRDVRYFRPKLPIECLSSLSVAPQYARAHPPSAPQPMLIVDCLPAQPANRFIYDNFGTLLQSFCWWPLPDNLSDIVRSITLAPTELLNDKKGGYRIDGENAQSVNSLLQKMAEKRNSYGIAQLAADSVSRTEIERPYHEYFNLIVGDTFSDRILFWNERSRMPEYLGRDFTTLIVSPTSMEDYDFMSALVTFLKARNGVSRMQSTPWVEIRSTSLNTDELTSLRERLRELDRWTNYQVSGTINLDSLPPVDGIEKALKPSGEFQFNRTNSAKEFPIDKGQVRPPTTIPHHLQGVQNLFRATNGAWAIDLGPVDKVSLDLPSRTFSVEIARKWHTVRRGQNRE